MEYLVNGKKFTDIDEARKYEEQLKNEQGSKIEEYKSYIRSKLQVFKIKKGQAPVPTPTKYLAVIVDKEHLKYMLAIATELLGNQYIINDGELVESWSYTIVTDGDIIDDIVDSFVEGKSSIYSTLFVGNNIKTPESVLDEHKSDEGTQSDGDKQDSTNKKSVFPEEFIENLMRGRCMSSEDFVNGLVTVLSDITDAPRRF